MIDLQLAKPPAMFVASLRKTGQAAQAADKQSKG